MGERSLAERVDAAVAEHVLISGSPPPGGRDLDLVARPREQRAIAKMLVEQGFLERSGGFARFRGCTVESADLIPSASLGLPEPELDELFRVARPLQGYRQLVLPAPHHVLLLVARRVAAADGRLDSERRRRVEAALAADSEAWRHAAESAAAWGAITALAALRDAFEHGVAPSRRTLVQARAERLMAGGAPPLRGWTKGARSIVLRSGEIGSLVSFSGLDGAGKTTQVEALSATLEQLGFEVTVEWTRLEWTTLWENRALGWIAWPARAALAVVERLRRHSAGSSAVRQPQGGSDDALGTAAARSLREQSTLVTEIWSSVVAVLHALAQRRATKPRLRQGKICISDRYTLDAIVQLRYRYGEQRGFRFQLLLMKLLSPTPVRAYYIDVPPETAWERKQEQYDLDALSRQTALYREACDAVGARWLDGRRPPEQLCEEIARDVWLHRW